MAVSANTVWEIRSSGAHSNGGGFVTGASGVDYSQQDSAQYALTGLTTGGATAVVTSASAAADMVGNIAHVISGTNATAGFYEIISVSVGVSFTLDRNWCTGAVASGVINIGGAYNTNNTTSMTQFNSAVVAGNTVWIKSGSYTVSNNFSMTNGSGTARIKVLGYTTTRNDACINSNRPSLNLGSNEFNIGQRNLVANLSMTSSTTRTLNAPDASQAYNCQIINTGSTRAVLCTTNNIFTYCQITCPLATGIDDQNSSTIVKGCYIYDCVTGILLPHTTPPFFIDQCLFVGCTTAINISTSFTGIGHIVGCTFYGSSGISGTGISVASGATASLTIINNIFANLTTGITHANASNAQGHLDYNCFYNNTTNRTNYTAGPNDNTLNPGFRDASTRDFRVGANMKAAGLSMVPLTTSPAYMDIGAVQRLEDYPAASLVVSGTVYSNTETTGTYAPTPSAIAGAVWDEATSGHTTSGTYGAILSKALTVAKFLGLK